jgi:hypothetical protein
MDNSRQEFTRSSASLDQMGDSRRRPGGQADAVIAAGKRPTITDRHALALAKSLGVRPPQAHCYLGLETLYAKTARPEEPHAELTTAIHLNRAIEMTFWLPQAEVALAQIGG